MVRYQKGHKNSKGEAAPWTIVSCKTGKVLSSHKTKDDAEEHLQQMEYFKHAKNESVGEFQKWLGEQPKTPLTEAVQAMYAALFDE